MEKDLRQKTTDEADSTTEESKKNIRDLSLREAPNNSQRVSLQGSVNIGETEKLKEEKGVRSGKTSGQRILDNSDDVTDTNRNLAPPVSGDGGGGGGFDPETMSVTICENGVPVTVEIYIST